MTDYLLGSLSETDTERLDQMSLIDGEFADRLLVVEDDLVDSYARGELSGNLLPKFTSHYLASARNREKVKVASSLLLFADQAANVLASDSDAITRASPAPDQTVLRQAARPGFFTMPRLALQWGFAVAALLFLFAGAYLAYQNLRLRNQLAQTQTERAALEQREQALKRELDAQHSVNANAEQELAEVQERLAQLEPKQPIDQPREPRVVALNLLPQTRGVGQVPTITVPAGVDSVAIRLETEATGFPQYQLALKDSGSGRIVWRSARLRVKGAVLRASVKAELLKSQNYILELHTISAAGDAENVGNYPFRVLKR
jgi:hypothetical protein